MDAAALSMVLASAALHALWSVSIKGSRDPLVFNLIQTIAISGIALAWIPAVRLDEVPAAAWAVVAVTGVAHACYVYCLSRALAVADLSLVYPIARSTPAFLPFFAVPLLGEQLSAVGALGIAVVVGGMWLVNYAPDLSWRALLGPRTRFAYLTLGTTIAYGLLDKLGMELLDEAAWSGPLPRAGFYLLATSVSCLVFLVPLSWTRVSLGELRSVAREEGMRAFAAALVSLGSYGLILEALRSAPASYVVAARQSSVLFAVALSVVWLREQPGRVRVVGAFVTVVGVALIGLSR